MVLSQDDIRKASQILLESNFLNNAEVKDKMDEIKLSDIYDTNKAKKDVTVGEDYAVDHLTEFGSLDQFDKDFNALFESEEGSDFDGDFDNFAVDGEDAEFNALFESEDPSDISATDDDDALLESEWMQLDNDISEITQLLESNAIDSLLEGEDDFGALLESDETDSDSFNEDDLLSDKEIDGLIESLTNDVNDAENTSDEDDLLLESDDFNEDDLDSFLEGDDFNDDELTDEDDLIINDDEVITEDDINIVNEELGDEVDGEVEDGLGDATVADAVNAAQDELVVNEDEELIESLLGGISDIVDPLMESKDEDEDEDNEDEKSDDDDEDDNEDNEDEEDSDDEEDKDEEDDEFSLKFDEEEDSESDSDEDEDEKSDDDEDEDEDEDDK